MLVRKAGNDAMEKLPVREAPHELSLALDVAVEAGHAVIGLTCSSSELPSALLLLLLLSLISLHRLLLVAAVTAGAAAFCHY